MKLSKELTTVTPFSSAMALVLFILIPLIAFAFGIQYQALSNGIVSKYSPVPKINNYKCLATAWIDCMPRIGGASNPMCKPEYLQWAKANCPGFEGAAY